jgi:hypothetical protein
MTSIEYIISQILKIQHLAFVGFGISNGHSTANFASANFANVVSTCASTCGRVFGAFRVDVVTRQTRQHLPSRVARTRQTGRHSQSCVVRTRQTRRHLPKSIFEKNVTRLDKFVRVTHESCKFGVSGHSLVCYLILGCNFNSVDVMNPLFNAST